MISHLKGEDVFIYISYMCYESWQLCKKKEKIMKVTRNTKKKKKTQTPKTRLVKQKPLSKQ